MSTTAPARGPGSGSPGLQSEIARLRRADNVTNLGYLAFEHGCIAAVVGGTAWFGENRASWGLPWAWDVPVFAVAVVLMGGLMHRLAGLGHEASHYSLLKHKWANDFVGDVFCFFPILATIHFYRLFHMAHHQYTNDPRLDPDLVTLGPGKRVDDFPMGRLRFVLGRMLAPLTSPASFALFQFEYIYLNVLGKGNNVYMRRVAEGDAADPWPRVGTWLGVCYVLAVVVGQHALTLAGHPGWLIPGGLIGLAGAALVTYALPERWIFRPPFRQPYSTRFASVVRLAWYTAAFVAMGLARWATDGRSSFYVYLLWLLPLVTTLPYFLLLRDTYQHTNADDGPLTNTRVFFCDPLTRWAVFVYGQDLHVPHHLFPVVPHYRLGELHRLLKRERDDYAREVVEVHGTFANASGQPTVLDVLSADRGEGPRAHA